jgi:saccharopine dehydrogenase (NAD+, L-lysine forming)
MVTIGLIKEGKTPTDNRVALTPVQCAYINENIPQIKIIVQPCSNRCYTNAEYERMNIALVEDISQADILLGIKEVPVAQLIPNKTYLFFSHTRKQQPHNKKLLQAIIKNNITLIDYECLTHSDGTRIIGFGFFAGIVGAHNGMMAYGKRTGAYDLVRVYEKQNLQELVHTYFGLRLPNVKIAVTGSGRVAHGILEIMNLMEIHEVEPEEFLTEQFDYPAYVHLKGSDLYMNKFTGQYKRSEFHEKPERYACKFLPYAETADILMNGVYWDTQVPRLFEKEHITNAAFKIQTIADITDDENGSVPINLGDQTIENPVYGVDRNSLQKTLPYLANSIDVMAVGNLPNELPRDASRYFGEQLIKYILEPLIAPEHNKILQQATIAKQGQLTEAFTYLSNYIKD